MYVYDVYDPKDLPTYTTVTVINPPISKNEQEMIDLAVNNSKDTFQKEKKNSIEEEVKQNE